MRTNESLFGLPRRNGKLKDLSRFDASFFGVHAKQADVMDPGLRQLIELTYEAILDAGVNPEELRGSKTGVFIGQTFSESQEYFAQDADTLSGYSLLGTSRAMIANRVSYAFDFKGPSYCLDTACSSSLYAIQQAVSAIRQGDCDAAVVGGINLLVKAHTSLGFMRLSMLSPGGKCRTFDASGDGYVRSETTSALFLQKSKDARRIYATVVRSKTNVDGFKEEGITYPSGAVQGKLIQDVFSDIDVKPEEVSYVETHGTGTKVGDPEEVNTIDQFFCNKRKEPLLIGSVKSNMGHAEAAAGMSSIAKVIFAMETGIIPGNLHYNEPNPDIPGIREGRLKVVDKNTPWNGDYVSINGFGFGGANGHLLLKTHKKPKKPRNEKSLPKLVCVSGRTKQSVEHLLNKVDEHKKDDELISLIHDIHRINTPGHSYRGCTILGEESTRQINEMTTSERRQLWYVFTGMGPQWPGMGKGLMPLEPFSKAVHKCADALRPEGIDLLDLIYNSDENTFENILNSFVAIAAVQIGIVDVLRSLGLEPDGIIGHSVGEIGCAYADGAFTAEQTILAAYWRGKSIQDSKLKPGCMAAVGLSWDEIKKRLPEGVVAACHNSADNVTVSAPAELLDPFLKELSSEGIFNKKVNSSGHAFHSVYIADAGPKLRASLERIVKDPKPRSKRWISTSIPEDQWSSELASTSSAAYHVNNLLSPVLFHQGVCHIPDGSVVVEIAPHSLLQALLKRSLPKCSVIGLVKKNVPDEIVSFLDNIGQIHLEGVNLDLKKLYPPVAYPVGRGTPMVSPMVQWDHSTEWQVPLFAKQTSKSGECVIDVDASRETDSYITGHAIDGRVLFPATGYLFLVWKTFAKIHGRQMEETPVIIEDVQIEKPTIIPKSGAVKFSISVFDGTGQFEISEGGTTVVTGSVKLMEEWNGVSIDVPSSVAEPYDLTPEDIYKELRLRGYEYGGLFKGIKKSDISGRRGELDWTGNWVSFMDTMLQFSLIGRNTRDLALPVRILKVIIDPFKHIKEVEAGNGVPIVYQKNVEIIQAGGVEIRNVKLSIAQRRHKSQAPPKLEKYTFVSYVKNKISSLENALTVALQILAENVGDLSRVKIAEIDSSNKVEPLSPFVSRILSWEPLLTGDITFATATTEEHSSLEEQGIKVIQKENIGGIIPNQNLIIGRGDLVHNGLTSIISSMKIGAFLLYEGKSPLTPESLEVIAKFILDRTEIHLFRKAQPFVRPNVVNITNANFGWVEEVKRKLAECDANNTKLLLVSQGEPFCGILGLVTCVRQEIGGKNLRCLFVQDPKAKPLSLSCGHYVDQLKKDLTMNVLSADGDWGSYRHLPLPAVEHTSVRAEHAYVNTLTRGDLSSLRWIQGPLTYPRKYSNNNLVTVYYAPLNFKDIMFASGKLPLDAVPGNLTEEDCILGLEFSGRNGRGERVMGIVEAKGLSTIVEPDPTFTWPVPETWTLQEAATVPIAYATAYYGLIVRGRMKPGESVLIHAGTGGVGQAAINIAVNMGCKVFTTVGTPQKRQFLKDTFSQLNDKCIGNSRDTSFEQLVLSETKGRGVDLVLNSLAEDKLKASVRCLANGGRFLEIGKLDLSRNTPLGMAILLKNTTVHGILLDSLMSSRDDSWEKTEVSRLFLEGIKSGTVKPLPRTTFNRDQIEESFRFMATGKHIGKVVIKIRDEEASYDGPTNVLFDAIPRTYMSPEKSYILVGGLGGFGLELANWLIKHGAKKIVLVSRSGVTNGFQYLSIKRWERNGAKILVSKTDCTSVEGAKYLINEAQTLGPVGGIFNLAAVLKDAYFHNQTEEKFKLASKSKVDGTIALDVASRACPRLDHFVTFSSVSCGRGNPGQSNYGFANSVMERICEARRATGLPGTAIQWGAIGDVGLVHLMKGDNDIVIRGTLPQRISSCLSTLDYFLQREEPVLASMIPAEKGKSAKDSSQANLVTAVARILGLKNTDSCGTKSLAELGMDSLMGTEIKQTLERNYDIILSAQEIRGLTFSKLRDLSSGGSQATKSETKEGITYKCILPEEPLVKMPSQSPKEKSSKSIFFIHPIEGVINMLEEVSSQVEGQVFGLQCIKDAPLASMEQLAAFYVQHITSAQKEGPYLIVGYSFGAAVAFQVGTLLEVRGQRVTLVLIDGSPLFVRGHMNIYKETKGLDKDFDAFRLAFVAMMFANLDFVQVHKEMLSLPTWESRLKKCVELMPTFSERDIADGADSFGKKLNISYVYEPKFKFNGEVILLKAAESFADLSEDYDLYKYCEKKVRIEVVPGDHKNVLVGKSSKIIADVINSCAKISLH